MGKGGPPHLLLHAVDDDGGVLAAEPAEEGRDSHGRPAAQGAAAVPGEAESSASGGRGQRGAPWGSARARPRRRRQQ